VQALEADGEALSPAMIAIILKNDHTIWSIPQQFPKTLNIRATLGRILYNALNYDL
jgi:hypothetical protein